MVRVQLEAQVAQVAAAHNATGEGKNSVVTSAGIVLSKHNNVVNISWKPVMVRVQLEAQVAQVAADTGEQQRSRGTRMW
jgi:hypothetical protein